MRRTIGLLSALAIAFTVVVPAAATSYTHAAQHRYLMPLAGSAQYLLYAEGRPGDPRRQVTLRGTLYARSKSGARTTLLQFHRETGYRISVLGAFVVISEETPPRPLVVRWWDLTSGSHGKRSVADAAAAQAAPGGWLYTTGGEPESVELWRETTDGVVTLLGAKDVIRNSRIGYLGNTKRVVVYGNDEGHGSPGVGWIGYAHPGDLHQILSDWYADCSPPSSGLVACSAYTYEDPSGFDYAMRLLPLNGDPIRSDRRRCDSGDTAIIVRHRAVWVTNSSRKGCIAGRLISIDPSGRRTVSTMRVNSTPTYNRNGLVSAFGRIVALSRSHRTIYSLRSVTAEPKVLVHTK